MNQFLSNKIIAGIVALALLVGVGVLVSSGDTSSTTRNAALVVATPCTKPGQVTKVSKQSVVCAKTNTGSLWYATMKAKGKAQACKSPGAIRKKSDIVWVCGVVKKKKLWQATQPLPPAVVASTTGIEPGATQPTPALDSTQVATPEAPVVADNTVLADTKIPDDKIVTQVIEDVTTPTVAPTSTTIPKTYQVGEMGPGGGAVFYVASSNFISTGSNCGTTCKYLEAAPIGWITSTTPAGQTNCVIAGTNSVDPRCEWSGNTRAAIGTYGRVIGTGYANTSAMIAQSSTAGKAATVARAFRGGGKTDWFLPSIDELNALCKWAFNDTVNAICNQSGLGRFPYSEGLSLTNGGFTPANYWSSTEYDWSSSEFDSGSAWFQNFKYGGQNLYDENTTDYVRPVRAF